FQAEDGIRDRNVTGVQTCALPIFSSGGNYTDASGQQWICDEFDFKNKKFIKRTGRISFDGSEDEVWGKSTTGEKAQQFAVALPRSEEHTSELQSRFDLVCRLLLEK